MPDEMGLDNYGENTEQDKLPASIYTKDEEEDVVKLSDKELAGKIDLHSSFLVNYAAAKWEYYESEGRLPTKVRDLVEEFELKRPIDVSYKALFFDICRDAQAWEFERELRMLYYHIRMLAVAMIENERRAQSGGEGKDSGG